MTSKIRQIVFSGFILSYLLFAWGCQSMQSTEYRIDSQAKFDELRTATFGPGEVILFKRGAEFTGMFAPRGQGEEGAPIRIDVYGEGDRPLIQAMGKDTAGLFLKNPSYWEVNGLEITNTDGTDEDQGDLFGIYVLANGEEGVYEHVYINDCNIHDVNGKVAGKRRGGIHVHIKDLEESKFHDLRITNNRIVNVGGVGIGNTSSCGRVEIRDDDYVAHNLWTKVYVADNYVDYTGRNNVIARVSKDAIYERNVLANSSRYSTGHSIFCFDTDGIKIQYNEAYGNVGPGGHDRGGFDADWDCVNTYIQYNYSHDNLWFCGIMKRPNRDVVIRYNISQNEKQGLYFYGFDNATDAENIHIYNNTHYIGEGIEAEVFVEERTPINTRFENNIFYFAEEGEWGEHPVGINTTFHNNLYHNISPAETDEQALTGKPGFINPGQAGQDIDLHTMEALRGYRLSPNSVGINAGVQIPNNGGQDILKTPVEKGAVDMGAVESH